MILLFHLASGYVFSGDTTLQEQCGSTEKRPDESKKRLLEIRIHKEDKIKIRNALVCCG